jgi:hypothetical protein
MILELRRTGYYTLYTLGEIWINGAFFCYTCEAPVGDNRPKKDCIPCGTYRYRIVLNEMIREMIIELQDVPNRPQPVSIHSCCQINSMIGCIGVGEGRIQDIMTNSKQTIMKLIAILTINDDDKRDDECLITVSDGHSETPQAQIKLTAKEILAING